MSLTIGQTLQHRYQINNLLGQGGMGLVFQAYDSVLQRTVAIKVLPPQLTINTEFVSRFQREAIASANLHHPHIVTIHDVGQQDGEYFIIMEYLEGDTLERWLAQQGPIPVAQVNQVLEQVASALDHAHSRGIIHRDVKPSNIMLDSHDRAVLMDFGLVRAGEGFGPTRSSTVMGTPEYMAPEQILGEAIDRRTDIYALGVVIYELLSGKTPFTHTTPIATAYAHVHEAPPPLRSINKAIPLSIEAVVLKTLAKDPATRYQSAGDLARDFSQATRGLMPIGLTALPVAASGANRWSSSSAKRTKAVVPSPPASSQGVGVSPAGRPKVNAYLVTGALAVMVVLMVLLLWPPSGDRGDPPAPTVGPPVTVALTDTPNAIAVSLSPTQTPTIVPTATHVDTATPVMTPSTTPTRPPTATRVHTMTPTSTTPASTHTPTATTTPTETATPAPKPTNTPSAVLPTATSTAAAPAVALGAPQLLEPPDGETQISVAMLRYSDVSGATGYVVETRSDRPGQQEWRRWSVPGTETAIDLVYDTLPDYFNTPGAVFYWRVFALGSGGQEGTYSGERRFVFQRTGNATRGSTLEAPPSTGELVAVSGLLGLSFMLAMLIASGDMKNLMGD